MGIAGKHFSLCLMKKISLLILFLLSVSLMNAQQKISFDLGVIRQTLHEVNGLNISSFYHFSEKLAGGIEVNRFFPVTSHADADMNTSAWDIDINFHYNLPLGHHLYVYPISGISHTSEKEVSKLPMGEGITERFWSVNAGAGLLWQKGHWGFHTEYLYTWGHINQQFVLAGMNYELELGHHKAHKKHIAD